jgi:hypothetical protein
VIFRPYKDPDVADIPRRSESRVDHWLCKYARKAATFEEFEENYRRRGEDVDYLCANPDASQDYDEATSIDVMREAWRVAHATKDDSVIAPEAYTAPDPQTIKRREFLYGRAFARGYMGCTIAPGGVGKTSLLAVEALAMASGRKLIGECSKGLLTVWTINLEDSIDEMQLRFAAARQFHDVRPEDVTGRLFLNGAETELVVARETREGVIIAEPVVDAVLWEIRAKLIDVLIIDPFVSSHEVSENSNDAIDRVAKTWARIAREGNCAVHLSHHTRKGAPGQTDFGAEDARGAKALIDAARSARVINRMGREEADRFGIPRSQSWSYLRIDDAKQNMSKPAEVALWRHLTGTRLPTPGDEILDDEEVGLIEAWSPPDRGQMDKGERDRVLREIGRGEWREDVRAANWVGHAFAAALGLDINDTSARAEIRAKVRAGLKAGWIEVKFRPDSRRRERGFVVASQSKKSIDDLVG